MMGTWAKFNFNIILSVYFYWYKILSNNRIIRQFCQDLLHAKRTRRWVERTGDFVVIFQVWEIGRGWKNHGAEGALETGGGVHRFPSFPKTHLLCLRKLWKVHCHPTSCIGVYDHLRMVREIGCRRGQTIFAAVSVAFVVFFYHCWDVGCTNDALNFVNITLFLISKVDLASVSMGPHLSDAGQLGPADDANVKISRLVPLPSDFLLVRTHSHKIVLQSQSKMCYFCFVLIRIVRQKLFTLMWTIYTAAADRTELWLRESVDSDEFFDFLQTGGGGMIIFDRKKSTNLNPKMKENEMLHILCICKT